MTLLVLASRGVQDVQSGNNPNIGDKVTDESHRSQGRRDADMLTQETNDRPKMT